MIKNNVFGIYFTILASSTFVYNAPLKLYAIYTPSHKILADNWFLPSIKDNFTLVVKTIPQECATASFKQSGWIKTTERKVNFIIEAIQENMGNIFIFSDVDIQFFEPIEKTILKLMEGKDFLIQKDRPSGTVCSGFFVCRANQKTLALWQDVLEYMQTQTNVSDQQSLNHFLNPSKDSNKYGIIWSYLPTSFFGGGTFTGKQWKSTDLLPIPPHALMHHANYTRGIGNKISQLQHVRKRVLQMKSAQKIVHAPRTLLTLPLSFDQE